MLSLWQFTGLVVSHLEKEQKQTEQKIQTATSIHPWVAELEDKWVYHDNTWTDIPQSVQYWQIQTIHTFH